MSALRTANLDLAERRRQASDSLELLEAIAAFLRRASATGVLLDDGEERWSAQGLIDYWGTVLDRAGLPVPETTLAEFDSLLAPELPKSACPYLGLDAFSETNAALFFGRQRVVAELVKRLVAGRLVAVVGPSGSGKSSLVRAGLLPALRADAIPGSAGWQILPPMVPGSDPGAALDWALGEESGGRRQEAGQPSSESGRRTSPAAPRVIIIDQFEEAFTLCIDETRRKEFLSRLVAMVTDAGVPHRVVLTMRSDFEPFIARAEALQPLYEVGKVTLPPLTAGELRETIEGPAEQVGLKFEAGVVDALLGDILGEPAGLPLLQYSLLKLWEARERNRVTLAAYKQVGGGRLALARGADAAYAKLIPEEQVTARRILLRLVRPGEGLEITSNRVRRRELDRGGEDPGRVARVLKKLVSARLLRLTLGDTPDDTQVEVAHEALVRNWPTLVEWLEDERHVLRQRLRLSAAAEQWQRLGRDPAALLTGRLLKEAGQYEDLSELEQGYVRAGVEAEEAERERTARTYWFIIYVIERQRRVVDSQRLAFAAQTQFRDAPETGLLLAYEANVCHDNLLTEQTLREAIDAVSWRPTALSSHTAAVFRAVFSPDNTRILTASDDGTARLWDTTGQLLATLSDHSDIVYSAVFSPDGSHILTTSADNTARLWDATGQPLATLSGHSDIVYSAVFSPNGQHILTASADSTARLWDSFGQPFVTLIGHTSSVNSAMFSPDDTRILTASADGTAWLWDASGKPLATLSGHTDAVNSAVFSPNGTHILTASADGTARLWDASGKPLATLSGHTDAVNSAVFSPDGTRIITASGDETARLWGASGQFLAILKGHRGAVYRAVFSSDSQRMLTASADGTARLWDTNWNPLTTLSGHTSYVHSAVFSLDGSRILTASADGTARLWDASGLPIINHTSVTNSAVFSPDSTRILTASDDGTARLWDATGQPLATLSGHISSSYVYSAVFSPNGQRILTAAEDGTARLWDTTGQLLATLSDHSDIVYSAVFSPDGSHILTTSADNTARLWDATGQPLATLSGHSDIVYSAVFSPNGQHILTASADSTARLWDSLGQPLVTLIGHTSSVNSAMFSPDDTRILTASRDGTVRLWDAQGQPLITLSDHTGSIYSAVFSPNGTHILTASADGTARLWDASGQPLDILKGHTSAVNSVVFSPDGTRILTASADGTARLWDASGQPLNTLSGHTGAVYSAVFSPDGTRILTTSGDGTVRQYLVSSEDLRRAAACRVGRGLTPEEVVRFQVPTPLKFDLATRQCPPVYSWEVGK